MGQALSLTEHRMAFVEWLSLYDDGQRSVDVVARRADSDTHPCPVRGDMPSEREPAALKKGHQKNKSKKEKKRGERRDHRRRNKGPNTHVYQIPVRPLYVRRTLFFRLSYRIHDRIAHVTLDIQLHTYVDTYLQMSPKKKKKKQERKGK